MTTLAGVHPQLVAAVARISAAMQTLGHPIVATDGLRTTSDQVALFAQGRSRPGRIVTHADGVLVRSNHQANLIDGSGHAVDCAFLDAAGRPSWAETHPWRLYGEAAKSQGLRWGGDWTGASIDRPHVELASLER